MLYFALNFSPLHYIGYLHLLWCLFLFISFVCVLHSFPVTNAGSVMPMKVAAFEMSNQIFAGVSREKELTELIVGFDLKAVVLTWDEGISVS